MVLVDSSVWIESLRREGDVHVKLALENLLAEYEATFCGPVKLEVLGGARDREKLEAHFSRIPYLTMKDSAWNSAKQLAWRLRDRSCITPWNDILIAALSRTVTCRIYSVDKHFQMMQDAGAGILLYQPGYGGAYNPN